MKRLAYLLMTVAIITISCKKEGCTNPGAENYNSEADIDDGSCINLIDYEGTYIVKDSLYVNGIFNEYKSYELVLVLHPTPDSVVFSNMWGYGNTILASKTEFAFTIAEQPYDQNTTVTGTGTFDFGKLTYKTKYGDLRHSGIGTKK
ncbi:MAG: hypothetical protein AB8B74_15320 [Crocinitomicaceae bacterium]